MKTITYNEAKEILSKEVLTFLKSEKKIKRGNESSVLFKFKRIKDAQKYMEENRWRFSYLLDVNFCNFSAFGNGIVYSINPVCGENLQPIKND